MSLSNLSREKAYEFVSEQLSGNLLKHVLAVEAGMRRLAEHLGEDVDYWGLIGLVHDLDYAVTADDPDAHGFTTCKWLEEYKLSEEALCAIKAHPGHIPCQSRLDWALFATDPASGFIVACALMHPDKKLESIDIDFMMRRFDEKRFAAGASRENMNACTNLGVDLSEFLSLVYGGMLSSAKVLGL